MKIKTDEVKEFQAFFLGEGDCKEILSPYKALIHDPEPDIKVVSQSIFGLLEKEEQ